MLETEKKVMYKAFDFKILSDIPLPELHQINEQEVSIDIEILIDNISSFPSELVDAPFKHVVKDNQVMFYVPEVGFFSAQEGKRITVCPLDGADDSLVRLYILGTCMGVVLMQNKILPLHGSAVVIDGKAYAFVGESGAGKSTLASAFLKRGYKLLSDDVIAVSLSHENVPFVTPSYPQQKLWQESLDNFGMDKSQYKSIYGRENKYSVPVSSHYFSTPVPLAGVFELVKTENEIVEIQQVEKLERLHTIFRQTYRNFIIPRLGLMDWHFHISTNIVNKLAVYRLSRPLSGFSAPQLVDLVINTVNKGE
ncbi:HPr kinase/phosphorylase [Bacillus sp. NPDC077411]|uniref:HPr kinase/phosphorylase n=1 Tax=Bacillus sp. NPDC077411 TaxID=3363947 RepID=UPI0037C6AB64